MRRGFTRRLGADWAYSGNLTKNPFHRAWPTVWLAHAPYRLDELNDSLTPDDKLWHSKEAEIASISRNCTLFEKLRRAAYEIVMPIKRSGGTLDDFTARLSSEAMTLNSLFAPPLSLTEVRGIVRSVAKWTWSHFSEAGSARFRQKQAARIAIRWKRINGAPVGKPWESAGISRATYYRRRSAGLDV